MRWLPLVLLCALVGCKQEEPARISATPSPVAVTVSPSAGPIVDISKIPGTWKVDIQHTTVPTETPASRAEEASARMVLKADGTYETMGGNKPQKGKWKLVGDQLSIIPSRADDSSPPAFTIKPDGSSMFVQLRQGDSTYLFVMMKA